MEANPTHSVRACKDTSMDFQHHRSLTFPPLCLALMKVGRMSSKQDGRQNMESYFVTDFPLYDITSVSTVELTGAAIFAGLSTLNTEAMKSKQRQSSG